MINALPGGTFDLVPLAAVGQPGRFKNSKAAIGENTAFDLGPDFPGTRPSELLSAAIREATAVEFDIHVCNDGRAQFAGIMEHIRRRDPDRWKRLLNEKVVYLGIGTGLGFGYGAVSREGVFTLHDLHSAFDVTASREWEALPPSAFHGMKPLHALPFQHHRVVCGKAACSYLHTAELSSSEALFTDLTYLKNGSRETVLNALRALPPASSPLGAALVNLVLADDIPDAKTELLMRLKADELLARLRSTLANFSSALASTMVKNIDGVQAKAIVEQIEKAHRRGKRVQFIGIGKSHLIGENLAQIFTNLGIAACSFELTGANCENLSAIQEDDVVFLISNSGESTELLALFPNLTTAP